MKREMKSGTYTLGALELPFNFYTDIPMNQKVRFLSFVTDTIVDENYYSMLRELLFDFAIINFFTDVDVEEIKNDADVIGKMEEFLEDTNIVQIVTANMRDGLLDELNEAVDENIQYRTGISKNDFSKELTKLVKMVEEKFQSIDVDNMMSLAEQIGGIGDNLTVDKLVEAYANTENFKGNQAAVVDAKNQQIRNLRQGIENKASFKNFVAKQNKS